MVRVVENPNKHWGVVRKWEKRRKTEEGGHCQRGAKVKNSAVLGKRKSGRGSPSDLGSEGTKNLQGKELVDFRNPECP